MAHAFEEIGHLWIPLADGCRLAARLWLPACADERPVPAILEYLPYRKDDVMAARDARLHRYFASHGYASIRVDLRGSGSSDGVYHDEYLPQEQDDAMEVIAWLAAQPWCSGSVGMFGISWGGFNGLQVAARRPPALKAIVTLCATDDRYADDVHYMGGCVLPQQMLPWATTMLAYNALPPLPSVVGTGWREQWLTRLGETPPFIEPWLTHQRRDAYWRQGSVCEDYAAIQCAVYAVGGWADGYSNAIPRLLAGLPGPRKGLIGPWAHAFPQDAQPGPSIGFLQECVRWWNHWLGGIDNGIMAEPMLRAWISESLPPASSYQDVPGRWVAENGWPPRVAAQRWALNAASLDPAPAPETELAILGSAAAGQDAGIWGSYGAPGDFPPDQRAEDGRALSFTSPPLDERTEILGFPEVTLSLESDRPQALVAVRLCDVRPDGASTLITRGQLNLSHRDGHDAPRPLIPGERYTVTVTLDAIGYDLPAGHRLRVAISPTYWPLAWPSPEPATLTVFTGRASWLDLPVRAARPDDDALRAFGEPEEAAPLESVVLRTGSSSQTRTTDVIAGIHRWVDARDEGRVRLTASGIEMEDAATDCFEIREGNPRSASVRCERTVVLAEPDWETRIEAAAAHTATVDTFIVTSQLDAYEGAARVFTRNWTFAIPRDNG